MLAVIVHGLLETIVSRTEYFDFLLFMTAQFCQLLLYAQSLSANLSELFIEPNYDTSSSFEFSLLLRLLYEEAVRSFDATLRLVLSHLLCL